MYINKHRYAENAFHYACTCAMGRSCYPRLGNHKLDTLCDHLGIVFDHHHAGSDSYACANLLIDYMRKGVKVERFVRAFSMMNCRTAIPKRCAQPSESTKQLTSLKNLLSEVTADGELNEQEVISLQNWLNHNLSLRGNYPFDKVFEIMSDSLADGILEKSELEAMVQMFEKIADPVGNKSDCLDFSIRGKTFCLTGEFKSGSRSSVQNRLSQLAGVPVNAVSSKTDYLIVGSLGSEAWAAGNYGTKVKKALEIQENGGAIQIVKEQEIADLLS